MKEVNTVNSLDIPSVETFDDVFSEENKNNK